MLANNEIGVIQPLAEISALCRQRSVTLHCDATQAVGKMPVDVDVPGGRPDELHRPQDLRAQGRRAGLHMSPGADRAAQVYSRKSMAAGSKKEVSVAAPSTCRASSASRQALDLCLDEMNTESARLAKLRNHLSDALTSNLADVRVCGPHYNQSSPENGPPLRLPNNLNVTFGNVDGEALLLAMQNLAVSSGAACTSTDSGPSHVLLALGHSEAEARSSLRFGLGRFNKPADIEFAIDRTTAAVNESAKAHQLASHRKNPLDAAKSLARFPTCRR